MGKMKGGAKGSMKKMMAAYEKSPMDNDNGVKEGSPADMKRDKKALPAFMKKMGAKKPKVAVAVVIAKMKPKKMTKKGKR